MVVVFRQALIQEQLILVQTSLGETRLLITIQDLGGHGPQRLLWTQKCTVIFLTLLGECFHKPCHTTLKERFTQKINCHYQIHSDLCQ